MYLSPEDCREILVAIPSNIMAKADRARLEREVLTDLGEIIAAYHMLRSRRQRYRLVEERRHWRRMVNLSKKLDAEMRRVLSRVPVFNIDDPHWPNRVLHELVVIIDKAEVAFAYQDTFRAFRGTKNPHREFLYSSVLNVWTARLGGALKYGRSRKGTPTGPLVRFFIACIEPVLKAETPRAGVADIIDRARSKARSIGF
jgi:hypothetical protein